ncbi:LacI family DNA-binding transcriptional regulator [Micromonospora sp. CPCC 205561]|uniref:LacI family DNA-binding transcriptional regulator n=1 Tax=Micromonospora sp. CPCC 205561 TaxID=3122407 RepID=UPI002FF3655A
MPTTLRDVARLAQVSVKTVSNVVNGRPHVSAEVRGRVEAAVDALGYRPNRFARTLRTGRSGALALVVSEVDLPGLGGLTRALAGAAARRGYRLVIDPVDADRAAGHPPPVDGCLLLTDLPAGPGVDALPLVRLGRVPGDGTADRVGIDHLGAGRDATAHLLATGCRRIAAIDAGPDDAAPPPPVLRGYAEAVRTAGLPRLPGHVQRAAAHRRADGYRAARAVLARPDHPDAFVCASDALAIGAMCAAFDAGLRVPEDLAVIGVGGSEEGHWMRPALSTVAADTGFIARQAVARLLARIARPDAAPVDVVAPHALLSRASTRGADRPGTVRVGC